MLALRPFQRRFLRGALAPGIDTAALSLPRGNGKSALAAHILVRALTPGDPLNVPGAEYLLCAASFEQARIGVFRPCRAELEGAGGYRFADSANRMAITHKATGTRLRVMSSSGKRAMGIVGCPLLVADEPGAWDVNNGQLMFDAIQTAQGKPGSALRAVYIGTLAPAGVPGHWWHSLVTGGNYGSLYVQRLQGNRKRWDQYPEIRRCNPLVNISARFRRKLLEERDAARRDTRLKARFMSYRLNVPTGDESTMLLTVDDWERTVAREVPETKGRPIVGIDLGGGRAWSAAVAMWRSGRTEAIAIAPGIPEIAEQEKRDRVPRGTYSKLVQDGTLRCASGLRVQPPAMLWEAIQRRWGRPQSILCDRFRLPELRDCVRGVPLLARISRWSESSADIRSLRKAAKDGPLDSLSRLHVYS